MNELQIDDIVIENIRVYATGKNSDNFPVKKFLCYTSDLTQYENSLVKVIKELDSMKKNFQIELAREILHKELLMHMKSRAFIWNDFIKKAKKDKIKLILFGVAVVG